jgi:hypothetical protein
MIPARDTCLGCRGFRSPGCRHQHPSERYLPGLSGLSSSWLSASRPQREILAWAVGGFVVLAVAITTTARDTCPGCRGFRRPGCRHHDPSERYLPGLSGLSSSWLSASRPQREILVWAVGAFVVLAVGITTPARDICLGCRGFRRPGCRHHDAGVEILPAPAHRLPLGVEPHLQV